MKKLRHNFPMRFDGESISLFITKPRIFRRKILGFDLKNGHILCNFLSARLAQTGNVTENGESDAYWRRRSHPYEQNLATGDWHRQGTSQKNGERNAYRR